MKTLGGLYAMMESRVSTYGKLCKLQGRLDLMLSQVWLQLSSSSSCAKAHTIRISWINLYVGYWKLPTYPSPKLTVTVTSYLGQNVGLGDG